MIENASIFIFASPSGGGKTSLAKQLVRNLEFIETSVSHTTRSMRDGEKEAKHYYFVKEQVFQQLVNDNVFIEHANVFGAKYGTSRTQIEQRLNQGIDVVLDIDWQGARQLKEHFTNVVSIFILPPSVEVLKERLQNRKQDDSSVIASRMTKAKNEIKHYDEFDYLIVNDDFDAALAQLTEIIRAHRLKCKFQAVKHKTLLSNLLMSK